MVGRDGLIGVYMMANRMHGAIYIGVTSDLITRADQHRRGVVEGFTRRYGLKRLGSGTNCTKPSSTPSSARNR